MAEDRLDKAPPPAFETFPTCSKTALALASPDPALQSSDERRSIAIGKASRRALKASPPLSAARAGSARHAGMVQPPRLERGTPRSTIWCSNQLSYGCTLVAGLIGREGDFKTLVGRSRRSRPKRNGGHRARRSMGRENVLEASRPWRRQP